MESVRIQKYLSDCGVMSRRKAEEEIRNGKVLVNNQKAEIGQKVDPNSDAVTYEGRLVEPCENKVYIKLNKPRGYVATLSDEKGRKCIVDLLTDVKQRVYPIGRLDLNSEGLLLLTNDGELANKLMHPKGGIKKTYVVKTKSAPSPEQMSVLNGPMVIDGYRIRPVRVTRIEGFDASTLKFELFEGRNRQIRKMCENVGLEVSRLIRISVGEIQLGNLKSGSWEKLDRKQIEYLKNI